MSLDDADTLALQREFARHLRDPLLFPPPEGMPEQRLQVYRALFYNNIESLLATNFPVIRDLLGEQHWHRLVRDFYREHAAHTPLFTEIGCEFQRYLDSRADAGRGDPPFLPELAHYEWVELALALDEHEIDTIAHDPAGDVVAAAPVLSPLAWQFSYRWPVQRLSAQHQPERAPTQPTHLVIVRNRRDEISFLELSPMTKVLFDLLVANPGRAGLDLTLGLTEALPQFPPQQIIDGATRSLREFRARDILLGTVLADARAATTGTPA
ncbi:MAG: putative DNA-binding domain-containing protein [Xanthomonadales bacterium]|nr:putative DNA-binding domain-containing protein [Xanthomonadales bacterium]